MIGKNKSLVIYFRTLCCRFFDCVSVLSSWCGRCALPCDGDVAFPSLFRFLRVFYPHFVPFYYVIARKFALFDVVSFEFVLCSLSLFCVFCGESVIAEIADP